MVRMTRRIKKIIFSRCFFQNIRELVNTVRTEIGALIDADRNNRKEHIISSSNKSKNINLSALKKKKKTKTKRTSKQ